MLLSYVYLPCNYSNKPNIKIIFYTLIIFLQCVQYIDSFGGHLFNSNSNS